MAGMGAPSVCLLATTSLLICLSSSAAAASAGEAGLQRSGRSALAVAVSNSVPVCTSSAATGYFVVGTPSTGGHTANAGAYALCNAAGGKLAAVTTANRPTIVGLLRECVGDAVRDSPQVASVRAWVQRAPNFQPNKYGTCITYYAHRAPGGAGGAAARTVCDAELPAVCAVIPGAICGVSEGDPCDPACPPAQLCAGPSFGSTFICAKNISSLTDHSCLLCDGNPINTCEPANDAACKANGYAGVCSQALYPLSCQNRTLPIQAETGPLAPGVTPEYVCTYCPTKAGEACLQDGQCPGGACGSPDLACTGNPELDNYTCKTKLCGVSEYDPCDPDTCTPSELCAGPGFGSTLVCATNTSSPTGHSCLLCDGNAINTCEPANDDACKANGYAGVCSQALYPLSCQNRTLPIQAETGPPTGGTPEYVCTYCPTKAGEACLQDGQCPGGACGSPDLACTGNPELDDFTCKTKLCGVSEYDPCDPDNCSPSELCAGPGFGSALVCAANTSSPTGHSCLLCNANPFEACEPANDAACKANGNYGVCSHVLYPLLSCQQRTVMGTTSNMCTFCATQLNQTCLQDPGCPFGSGCSSQSLVCTGNQELGDFKCAGCACCYNYFAASRLYSLGVTKPCLF